MELRALEYFVAVAEEMSFTKAATRCHVAQPTISHHIAGLEKELGEQLFGRDSRRVTLSPGGVALLPHARACLGAASAAREEFEERAGLLKGELALATVDGVEETALPVVLRAFHERHPAVAVSLGGGTSVPLLAQVQQGRLDAAIVARPLEPLPADFSWLRVLGDRIVALVGVNSRWAEAGEITPEQIAAEQLITYDTHSGLHALISAAFRRAGTELVASYSTNDVALQVALAGEGVGIALSAGSDPSVRYATSVVRVPVVPEISYEKLLVWRRDPQPGAPLRAFLTLWAGLTRDPM
ncbi:LysR family transcriptional regulator [Actinacidiphila acididurans]|uniref:LysR family transcriptional regulator n=1 Tax=Actinacidiphila acididurans TaxID=2784346 RepID=A0ABS2TNL3_9ACTN|nr:LysR family transcriptional regulator [Actinacidiphila acididurans]MBM9504412.1 LysR family transcriptional regulator [Actinacidiphila acididurans]